MFSGLLCPPHTSIYSLPLLQYNTHLYWCNAFAPPPPPSLFYSPSILVAPLYLASLRYLNTPLTHFTAKFLPNSEASTWNLHQTGKLRELFSIEAANTERDRLTLVRIVSWRDCGLYSETTNCSTKWRLQSLGGSVC